MTTQSTLKRLFTHALTQQQERLIAQGRLQHRRFDADRISAIAESVSDQLAHCREAFGTLKGLPDSILGAALVQSGLSLQEIRNVYTPILPPGMAMLVLRSGRLMINGVGAGYVVDQLSSEELTKILAAIKPLP